MKFKNSLAVLLLGASVQVFGQSTEAQSLPSGVKFQNFTNNQGPKIKLNDVITFNFIQKTDKDSVLFSSFQAGRPATIQVQPSQSVADLMDVFPLMAVKDSALIKVPTDSIFKGADTERPPFFPKGSYLSFIIKIEKVQSMEEAMAEQQKAMAEMKSAESAAAGKYITDNKLKPLATASGLKYVITKAAVKPKPVKGDTVWVNYVGRTLEGKVFDSSIEAEAKKAGLEQPGRQYEPISLVLGQGQVIPGWEEALLLLNEGARAKLIIPSDLAYGPRGAGEDIKPFSTLVFDVELVKVKKPKKAATSSAKPAPAKKVTSPAKKPATVKKPVTSTKPKTAPKK